MNISAIILPKENSIPALLSIFILPSIVGVINFKEDEEDFLVYIVECPAQKGIVEKRWVKSLNRLCEKKEIRKVLCSKNIKLSTEIKYEFSLIDPDLNNQIEAIKSLSALIRISELTDNAVTESDIGFIMGGLNEHMLKILSDEASSIMIYEKNLDSEKKKLIYDMLMYDKGMPPAFTDNIKKIAANSQVIIVDEGVNLREYYGDFKSKILVGENCVSGKFIKIEKVLMWINSEGLSDYEGTIVKFNDELVCILRDYLINNNAIDFIKRLQYIKLLDENGKEIKVNKSIKNYGN